MIFLIELHCITRMVEFSFCSGLRVQLADVEVATVTADNCNDCIFVVPAAWGQNEPTYSFISCGCNLLRLIAGTGAAAAHLVPHGDAPQQTVTFRSADGGFTSQTVVREGANYIARPPQVAAAAPTAAAES
eukprot:gnl/Hemi2/13341_TR4582_c0_g1_i1.p1 gnl/Hemi2/13341_TR4582_c0_g1~~gnl/Hemi2/13341_TR4582_c0_g1_i1.p1  ORF type:complete len:131 (+),score=42.86 gnl/Hemi2/13341_TR4582_c0_g1_i1:364-756(+)